ncbi:hypothetical protein [Geobacillus sp. FW23]|uniref:hypothetical protein n=1 Tax=Geobacillus sp. FW23 TaxID=1048208 RepID=UPI00046A0736|nr:MULTISPECIES: hypothetical protein [Geobacillus]
MRYEHREEDRHWVYRFSWLHLMRPPTWSGTISPVLAATALAAKKGAVRIEVLLAMLAASVLIQSAVNMLNLTFRTLTRSKQRIFYLVFQNNFLTNTTSDGYPFFTIAGRSV